MQSWWTAESESQPYLYKWQFHVMATCIKCICDGIPVLLPISKNIFHSGRKQKHWQSFTQNYQTNTFFSFSVLTTHSETQQLKADCAFFQLLRTDTRDYMYLYGKGSCIPSLSFLVLLLGASPLPGFKKKKKKIPAGYWAHFPLTSNSFVLWRSYLAALQVSFPLRLWSLSTSEAAWRSL